MKKLQEVDVVIASGNLQQAEDILEKLFEKPYQVKEYVLDRRYQLYRKMLPVKFLNWFDKNKFEELNLDRYEKIKFIYDIWIVGFQKGQITKKRKKS